MAGSPGYRGLEAPVTAGQQLRTAALEAPVTAGRQLRTAALQAHGYEGLQRAVLPATVGEYTWRLPARVFQSKVMT